MPIRLRVVTNESLTWDDSVFRKPVHRELGLWRGYFLCSSFTGAVISFPSRSTLTSTVLFGGSFDSLSGCATGGSEPALR